MNSLLMTQEELGYHMENLQRTSENKSYGLLAKPLSLSISLSYIVYNIFYICVCLCIFNNIYQVCIQCTSVFPLG